MKKAADQPTTKSVSGQDSPFRLRSAFFLIGDTTARLFFPAVGGTLLGLWADRTFDTKPWFMACGIILGAATALYLVRRQLQAVRQSQYKENK